MLLTTHGTNGGSARLSDVCKALALAMGCGASQNGSMASHQSQMGKGRRFFTGGHVLRLPTVPTENRCLLQGDWFKCLQTAESPEALYFCGSLEPDLVLLSYPKLIILVFQGLERRQARAPQRSTLDMLLQFIAAGLVSIQGWALWKSTQCDFELLSHLLGAVPEEFHPTYLRPTPAGFLLQTTWNRKCLCSLCP